jgi:LysR family transcriptional activator of nhaA
MTWPCFVCSPASAILVEHCRIPEVTERFYAIVQKRRLPNQLLGELLDTGNAVSQAH